MTDFVPSASIEEEVMAFLLTSPTPKQIMEYRASDVAQHRLRYLLDANRKGTLTSEEATELEVASNINHFMMTLKAKAHLKGTE